MDSGKLSQLQLEGILYACTKHLSWLPSGERWAALRRCCFCPLTESFLDLLVLLILNCPGKDTSMLSQC